MKETVRHCGALRCAGGLMVACALWGCGKPAATEPKSTAPAANKEASTPAAQQNASAPDERPPADAAPAEPGTPRLTPVDAAGLQAVLDRNRGKVILVDFWSTTCIPCMAALPKTGEVGRKYADGGLAIVTVAMDDPQEEETESQFHERVLAPLVENKAVFTSLLSKPGGGEEGMLAFGIDGGAIPHYRIYGRDGRLIQKFVMGDPDQLWEHADVIAAVEQALEK